MRTIFGTRLVIGSDTNYIFPLYLIEKFELNQVTLSYNANFRWKSIKFNSLSKIKENIRLKFLLSKYRKKKKF